MKWDNLTMSQKQALMKIYVNNGVTNLDEIVNHYNRFSEGGSKETVESPNTVLYSRTPRELVGNVVNTRPVSYITRPRRINRFDDGGEFTLTDIIEGNSYLDYLKNKYKDIKSSKDSNELTASDVTNAISSNIKSTTEGLSKTAQKIVEDKEEKRKQTIYENELMLKSLAQAAEFAAAGYIAKNFAMSHGWIPNTNIVNGVYQADQMQKLANGVGFAADGIDRYYANTPYKKAVSDMELIGDVAGYIGGTNWFRNTPLFGRHGNTIDDVLDKAGFASAGYDLLEVPVEWIINQYGKKSNNKEENTKKYGGKVNRFNDGGVKSRPTREEYITSKIDSTINVALNKSRTRKEPANPLIVDSSNRADTELHITNAHVDAYSKAAATAANKGNYDAYYSYMNDAAYYAKRATELKKLVDAGLCEGNSCIYTSTDNYGKQYRVASNPEFSKNPNEYGFTKINTSDRKPGDLQQVVIDYNNKPYHMMMFNGFDENNIPRFNYSSGGNDRNSIRINGQYPLEEGEHIDTYRFVGTPEDSARWTEQYFEEYPIEIPFITTIGDVLNKSNKKKYGGKLKKNKK